VPLKSLESPRTAIQGLSRLLRVSSDTQITFVDPPSDHRLFYSVADPDLLT